jgi:hypothetical protein
VPTGQGLDPVVERLKGIVRTPKGQDGHSHGGKNRFTSKGASKDGLRDLRRAIGGGRFEQQVQQLLVHIVGVAVNAVFVKAVLMTARRAIASNRSRPCHVPMTKYCKWLMTV